jgi:type I restriction enzyme R subunit
LQKISEGRIDLHPGKKGEVSGPSELGTGKARSEKIELSQLIDILNERLGTDFKPGDQLFFDSIREDAVADPSLRQAAVANTMENFGYVFIKALEGLFIDRMEQNEEITAKYLNEKDFKKIVSQQLLQQVYNQIKNEQDVTAGR